MLAHSVYHTGLLPIGKLSVGTQVLAYNEVSGQNGYYPITAVHRNLDPELTSLWVKSNTGAGELIQTTPEHPFYLASNVDASPRPQPEGHADLNSNWVGAGHLKIGDKIRQADGTSGVVSNVTTYEQTREMFNLTVKTAHTFYVGTQGWLVHNAKWPCNPVSSVFKGNNEYEDLIANHLEDLYPGHVQFVGLKQYKLNGDTATDWDVVLRNAVIEIKSGGVDTAQILNQDALLKASKFPGTYIVYAPKIQGTVERNLKAAGIIVVKDLQTLEELVKP